MSPEQVFLYVTTLPANDTAIPGASGPKQQRQLKAYGDALDRMVPYDKQSRGMKAAIVNLRCGHEGAGAAARGAVLCGADPEVVVATARLILT